VQSLAQPGAKLLDQPRLADARLADDQRQLAFAGTRALPAPAEQIELLLAADERRQRPRAAPPAAAARAHDAIEGKRFRHALEVMRASVLRDEQACDLPLHGRRHEHRPRLGRPLNPRRDVRRLAEHFAGGVDHDRATLDADAGGKLGRAGSRVPRVEVGERALDRERRAHGPLGVILLRLRIAEKRHQPIAEPSPVTAFDASSR
jgi:hypothetical protein